VKFLLSLFFIFLSFRAQAASFYFVHPGGEGDGQSARPYLQGFFDYLEELSGLPFEGKYLNNVEDAEAAFKEKSIDLAIVSPKFYKQFHKKLHLKRVLKTIPVYSTGPYEKYYIMSGPDVDFQALMKQSKPVHLFASGNYSQGFLRNQLFEGEDLVKVPWKSKQTDDLLAAIKKVAEGEKNSFVLLTGHEFSVVNKMRKKDASFKKLMLVFTSKGLASSSLVMVKDKVSAEDLVKVKKALLKMPESLTGNVVLKRIRLKGFAE
jgi:ABC-type phosphate/phosphonate transport system substrate-binding protein